MNTKYILHSLLIAAICTNVSTIKSETILHTICQKLFGSKVSNEEIQKFAQQARKDFEINPTQTPVIRTMNNCPLWQKFISFTWFGTWIKSNSWKKLTDKEKLEIMYHEIAHQKNNHPCKQIGTAIMTVIGGYFASGYFTEKKKLRALSALLSSIIITGLYTLYCEKSATNHALEVLKNHGHIV